MCCYIPYSPTKIGLLRPILKKQISKIKIKILSCKKQRYKKFILFKKIFLYICFKLNWFSKLVPTKFFLIKTKFCKEYLKLLFKVILLFFLTKVYYWGVTIILLYSFTIIFYHTNAIFKTQPLVIFIAK